jgi:hypothetical protein
VRSVELEVPGFSSTAFISSFPNHILVHLGVLASWRLGVNLILQPNCDYATAVRLLSAGTFLAFLSVSCSFPAALDRSLPYLVSLLQHEKECVFSTASTGRREGQGFAVGGVGS